MPVWPQIRDLTAGRPGSGELVAALWQYRQFICSATTCGLWGKRIGCSGARPCGVEPPLTADRRMAAAARARSPGYTAHFFLVVIARGVRGRTQASCEIVHKPTQRRV